MTRQPGSGLYRRTSEAVEDLLAAHLRADSAAVAVAVAVLSSEHEKGLCGMLPTRVEQLVAAAAAHMGSLTTATRLPVGNHADVVGRDAAGVEWAYEVKAQTTKVLAELVEADWVRQETDWLRAEAAANASFSATLSPVARGALASAPTGPFNLDQFLACDLAVLPTAASRAQAGVVDVWTLRQYARRKWLVHLAQDGVALIRIDQIPLFTDAVAGAGIDRRVRLNRAGPALHIRRLTAPRMEYVSYNYDRSGIYTGRHKMHRRATASAVVLT